MGLPTVDQAGFGAPAVAYDYRALKRETTRPIQRGWDVYALQTGFKGLGYSLPKYGADGWLGDETAVVIWKFQKDIGLKQDGIAGILTQRAVAVEIANRFEVEARLPEFLIQGQIEKESGFQLGNHTAVYPRTGRYDIGVVQQNYPWTTDNCRYAFDTFAAIKKLATHKIEGDPFSSRGLRPRFDNYHGRVGAGTVQRAWELAAGSWNAPAWADDLAYGRYLNDTARASIEAYIDRVTAYVVSWTA